MKIRTEKEFNLPEMIQYIMDNEELKGQNYAPRKGWGRAKISNSGDVFIENVSVEETFIVEVEEELMEDTFLKDFKLVGLIRKGKEGADYEMAKWGSFPNTKINIIGIKDIYDLKSLHKINDDGSLTLLYTEENGIPADGVLEY